jgi:tetratricopeptide (TPR) repeat protein
MSKPTRESMAKGAASSRLAVCVAPFFWLATLSIFSGVGCGSFPNSHNSAGVQLYQQGQMTAAMQQFQQALLAEPQNADAYYNLAATYHRIGSQQNDRQALTQAENLYNQCLDRDDNHVDCYRGLAVLLVETDRSDRAFALLQGWATRRPQSAQARVELARLYEEFGDTETAKNNLQTALQLDQNNARAWAALGRLREQAGDPAQALANYQRSLQINRQQPAVAERVALLQSRMPGATAVAGAIPNAGAVPSGGAPGWPAWPTASATAPGTATPGAPAPGGAVPPRTVQGLPAPPRY